MIRVLHILGGLGTGGTESLIMNWYRNIDRKKIQFDFLVRSRDDNYAKEIKEMGGRIFYTSSFPRHFIKNYRETYEILKRKEWNVIHVHGNAAMYILPLRLAKKLGYKCRIMHSHSVKAQNRLFSLAHFYNRARISKYATHHFACSEKAGYWMFGKNDFKVLKNAVAIDEYLFDALARDEHRKKLNINDKYVVGHVGRFAVSKNHLFLLEIFSEIKKRRPNSILMLVGDGELENTVKEKAAQLGIADSVLFLGRRNDVNLLMSAMDIFLLPSLYEGLGIVLVEAQASGLPCVVSEEAFVDEVQITSNLTKMALKYNANIWAKHILEISNRKMERFVADDILVNSGYNLKTEIVRLEEIYLQSAKGGTI